MAINWKRVRQTVILATFIAAVVLLTSGCAVTVNPGNLWVGIQPTWAENKKVENSSYTASSTSGPWGRATSSTDTTRLSYTLGHGANRQRCYSNESNSVSMTKPSGGSKQVTTQLSVNANCVADPELPVPPKSGK